MIDLTRVFHSMEGTITSEGIAAAINLNLGTKVSSRTCNRYLKERIGNKIRKKRLAEAYTNTKVILTKRLYFVKNFVNLMVAAKRILNVD
jgi:hypothetical protein